MSYTYGAPSERPRCWGDSRVYETTSRECRSCPFQNSCGDQITRARNAHQLAQATIQTPVQQQVPAYGNAYFAQYAPPQVAQPLPVIQPATSYQPPPTYQAPATYQTTQVPVQVRPVQPTPAPVQPVPVQTVQTGAQMMQRPAYPPLPVAPPADRYGWMADPLYYTIAATPVPPRPQYEGETFVARVGKNMMLDMAESFFKQCLLGIRQVVLPPDPPQHMHVIPAPPGQKDPKGG